MTVPAAAVVLDSSAVLAWLRNEPGADQVDPLLRSSIMCSANWSEVWQKLDQRGVDADRATQRLQLLGVRVEPLSIVDAIAAARLWARTRDAGLSLADRCCLALAARLGLPAVTADSAWAALDLDVMLIRRRPRH